MKRNSTILKLSSLLFIMLLSPLGLAARVVESQNPYPRFVGYRQNPDEFICWAAAGKAILKAFDPQNIDSVCQVVSKVRNQNCCLGIDGIQPECNQAGRTDDVLSRYGYSQMESGIDFERFYQALSDKRLIALIVNYEMFNGKRRGHVVVIYRAERLSNGKIRFYVADSASGYFDFDNTDVKRRRNGNYELISLNRIFILERALIAFPK